MDRRVDAEVAVAGERPVEIIEIEPVRLDGLPADLS